MAQTGGRWPCAGLKIGRSTTRSSSSARSSSSKHRGSEPRSSLQDRPVPRDAANQLRAAAPREMHDAPVGGAQSRSRGTFAAKAPRKRSLPQTHGVSAVGHSQRVRSNRTVGRPPPSHGMQAASGSASAEPHSCPAVGRSPPSHDCYVCQPGMCGTFGCQLPDNHLGLCTVDRVAGKRTG